MNGSEETFPSEIKGDSSRRSLHQARRLGRWWRLAVSCVLFVAVTTLSNNVLAGFWNEKREWNDLRTSFQEPYIGPSGWSVAEAVDHLAANAIARWPRGSELRVLMPMQPDEPGWPFIAGFLDRLARINDIRFRLYYSDDALPANKGVLDAYDIILTASPAVLAQAKASASTKTSLAELSLPKGGRGSGEKREAGFLLGSRDGGLTRAVLQYLPETAWQRRLAGLLFIAGLRPVADIDKEGWRQGELAGLLLNTLYHCDDLVVTRPSIECAKKFLSERYDAVYGPHVDDFIRMSEDGFRMNVRYYQGYYELARLHRLFRFLQEEKYIPNSPIVMPDSIISQLQEYRKKLFIVAEHINANEIAESILKILQASYRSSETKEYRFKKIDYYISELEELRDASYDEVSNIKMLKNNKEIYTEESLRLLRVNAEKLVKKTKEKMDRDDVTTLSPVKDRNSAKLYYQALRTIATEYPRYYQGFFDTYFGWDRGQFVDQKNGLSLNRRNVVDTLSVMATSIGHPDFRKVSYFNGYKFRARKNIPLYKWVENITGRIITDERVKHSRSDAGFPFIMSMMDDFQISSKLNAELNWSENLYRPKKPQCDTHFVIHTQDYLLTKLYNLRSNEEIGNDIKLHFNDFLSCFDDKEGAYAIMDYCEGITGKDKEISCVIVSSSDMLIGKAFDLKHHLATINDFTTGVFVRKMMALGFAGLAAPEVKYATGLDRWKLAELSYLLPRLLYDPRVKPGMTRRQAKRKFIEILQGMEREIAP